MYCPFCGAINRYNAIHCSSCGERITLPTVEKQTMYALKAIVDDHASYWSGDGWVELGDAFIANDHDELTMLRAALHILETRGSVSTEYEIVEVDIR